MSTKTIEQSIKKTRKMRAIRDEIEKNLIALEALDVSISEKYSNLSEIKDLIAEALRVQVKEAMNPSEVSIPERRDFVDTLIQLHSDKNNWK
jgi:hypothetical protein